MRHLRSKYAYLWVFSMKSLLMTLLELHKWMRDWSEMLTDDELKEAINELEDINEALDD